MEFLNFRNIMIQHVQDMTKDKTHLYTVDLDKEELWNIYLDNFPVGTNEIFRERREHDCACCKQFIKTFGNVVSIKNNQIVSVWDFVNQNIDQYYNSIFAMSSYVHEHKIKAPFITKNIIFGVDKNYEQLNAQSIKTWYHFYIKLDQHYKFTGNKTCDSVINEMVSTKNVLKRSFDEITTESIETVLELITDKALYRGEEWKSILENFYVLHGVYHQLPLNKQDIKVWEYSTLHGPVVGKIKNHTIGKLLTDLSNNVDLEKAVKSYESIVAPTNYKRPKAIFTKQMIENAKKKVEELGFTHALERRFATIDDMKTSNVIFSNKDIARIKTSDPFKQLEQDVTVNVKNIKSKEIPIVNFIKNIIPKAHNIEVLMENRLETNLMSVIAPKNYNAPSMFKWDNGFSWAYNGNITDSMKKRVQALGGKTDGVLRFSIQWNTDGNDDNDLDAHCIEPLLTRHNEIYFSNRGVIHKSSGMLDVDIIHPMVETGLKNHVAVENIIYTDKSLMPQGTYSFYVNMYAYRNTSKGFSAEIEFDGQIYQFEYKDTNWKRGKIKVAEVNLNSKGEFDITEFLKGNMSNKKIWNIRTNQFIPVSLIMLSPNYWNYSVGNKHWFFIIQQCKNDTLPNGFFNEYLKEELKEHKKVFEALGRKMQVKATDNQLSGLGFSSTKRNYLICKVNSRIYKVTF